MPARPPALARVSFLTFVAAHATVTERRMAHDRINLPCSSSIESNKLCIACARTIVKASTAAAMQALVQDFRSSSQAQPSADVAFGLQKAEGMAAMLRPSCFAPPIARHALPLPGAPGSLFPPVCHRLKRMAGFRHCGTQKQYLSLPLQPPGKIRPRAATPGHTRSHPVISGGADGREK